MTQRRTYQQQRNQTPGDDGMGGVGVEPPPPPPPPQSTWLRTTLSIALGAVVGAVAVDVYRRIKGGMTKNPDGDDDMQGGYSAMGGLPGGPSIMPFPMPLPMPMPMPMPMYGGGNMMPAYRDERPMTDVDKLELARLKAETAKAEAAKAHWDAWESGEID